MQAHSAQSASAGPSMVPAGGAARPIRVAWLAIASRGEAYDAMKLASREHLRSVPAGLCVEAQYVYGRREDGLPPTDAPTELDAQYDVKDSLIPGQLDKTLAALRGVLARGDCDFIVRTNLSTWFHWDHLEAFLRVAPREKLAAGYSPDGTHLCGCCIVMTPDAAADLVEAADDLDRSLLDDLAMSQRFEATEGMNMCWIPRIDVVAEGVLGHGAQMGMNPFDSFQVRIKASEGGEGASRMRDAEVMKSFTTMYAAGCRSLEALLNTAARAVGFDLVKE